MAALHRIVHPVTGYAVTVLCLAAMVCYSLWSWDDMPARIVTRQAAGRHGSSVVSRTAAAAAMPVVLAASALLLLLVPLWNRLTRPIALRSGLDRRHERLVWTVVLVMLSMLMLALHVGIIDMFTGRGPQLPQLVGWAMAAVLIGLAVICQVQRVRGRRAITAALVTGGVLVAALAGALPAAAIAVGTVVVLGAIVAVAVGQLRGSGLPGGSAR
ncbi:hypothetical protein [Propionibacterium australiense]|uniref:Uncharacterized protein n=1 Tax=Propionibacterium australiense TaxID=119981 RepID=A0A8B3FK52_9ACTN|nr:hypothetical protein [Propionibacterium australiense]RLP07116.1 hypothetical protein D7U36_11400 [Propionibacterium australiense]